MQHAHTFSHLIVAIHGILTRETDPSWVDHFDAWLVSNAEASPNSNPAHTPQGSLHASPESSPATGAWKLLKKEYSAGPWPRWNCFIHNPRIARGLAAEIELLLASATGFSDHPAIWFVAHSNGALIALETIKSLVARGHSVAGVILTGAACEAELTRTPLPAWIGSGRLGIAAAYSSRQDHLLAAAPTSTRDLATSGFQPGLFAAASAALWRWLIWPYGSLGRTGWLKNGRSVINSPFYRTRWFECGHSGYFLPPLRNLTFQTIRADILANARSPRLTHPATAFPTQAAKPAGSLIRNLAPAFDDPAQPSPASGRAFATLRLSGPSADHKTPTQD